MFGRKNSALTKGMVASILENVKEEALILSTDFRVLWANKKIMDSSGLKEESILGAYCYKITHHLDEPCKPPHDVCPIHEAMLTGKPATVTHTHFDKDGNNFYAEVSVYPVKNRWGKITQFVHVVRDVTVEMKLTDSIIANMIDTLIVVDPEGVIKMANKAALDLLGYTENELVGRQVGMIFAEEEEVLFKGTRLRKLIEEGSVRDFEMTYRTKAGEKIPVSFSGSVMYEQTTDQKIIGVVGIARDMRRVKALMADLEGTKSVVEDYALNLEKKVEERTKDLEQSQEATLNIMEDIQEEKDKVTEQAAELAAAHKELESFSKGLEEKVKERTMELSILYEVSNAISYTLDYQTLLKLIMESLFKMVDYDVCASLLFDAHTANITIKPAYSQSAVFVDEVKNSLVDSTSMLTGENIRKRYISAFLIPTSPDARPREKRQFDKLRSFFNVPFVMRGKTIGMINVSSCKENGFTEDDIKLIYTIANQASNAIERLQAVITAEKSKMESMVESMVEGVIMADERGEIVVLNPRARRMLGFVPDEEITSKTLGERMKNVGLSDALQECQASGKLITKEIVVPAEKSIILRSEVTLVKNVEGNAVGVVTVLRDITEEKAADGMKTEFISTVSHELRTPLSITKEGINLVLDKILGEINQKQEKILATARDNIDRLGRIINSLLDISRFETGKVELKRQVIDITQLARQAVSSFELKAKEKGLELKAVFSKEGINIYADADKITQIFTNLVGNALKFTEKGGIEIAIVEKEDEVECSVADSGIGISGDDLPRVFGRFQQFGRTAGGGGKGTGLGLSITKALVELHNGRIWVESKYGKGTNFTFSLPNYTAGGLFRECIDNGIKKAAEGRTKMSVIFIKEKLISEQAYSILKGIEGVLKETIRQADILFKNFEGVIVLSGCDREGALVVEGRVEQAVDDYLSRKNLAGKVKLKFGCVTYPDDGQSGEELIKKAKAA